MEAVRTQAAIPRKIDFARVPANEPRTEGLSEDFDIGTGKLLVGDAPNIVFAENSGVQHSSEV